MTRHSYVPEDLLETLAALDFLDTLGDEGARFLEFKTTSSGFPIWGKLGSPDAMRDWALETSCNHR